MELVRVIMKRLSEKDTLQPEQVVIDGYELPVVNRHVEMLIEAGLVEGPRPKQLNHGVYAVARDLTWAGHDFFAALSNESVWGRIKKSFSAGELATLPLTVLKDVGVSLLTQYAKQQVGLQ